MAESDLVSIGTPIQILGLGVFNGGEIFVPGTTGGDIRRVQLRAWIDAADYESATVKGSSDIQEVRLRGPGELALPPTLSTTSFQLSEVHDTPTVPSIERDGSQLTLRWIGGGRLQESVAVDGPYEDSFDQSNPQLLDTSTEGSRFFRVISP